MKTTTFMESGGRFISKLLGNLVLDGQEWAVNSVAIPTLLLAEPLKIF